MDRKSRTQYALTLLTLLYAGRIVGQLAARFGEVAWLPPDALWHAAVVPYSVLIAAQVALLAMMVLTIRRLDCFREKPVLAVLLAWFATAYAATMIVRFVVGAAGLTRIAWFDAPISTPFHLVLAGWLLIFAHHVADDHLRGRLGGFFKPAIMIVAYPAIMVASCALFYWLLRSDVPPKLAAYVAIVLGGAAILASVRETRPPASEAPAREAA